MDPFAPFTDTAPLTLTVPNDAQTDTAPLTLTVPNASQTDTAPLTLTVPNASQTDTAPLSVTVSNASQTDTAPNSIRIGDFIFLSADVVATASAMGEINEPMFGQTIDGIELNEDMVVLCINEENPSNNGLWIVQESENIRPVAFLPFVPIATPPYFPLPTGRLIVTITRGTIGVGKRYLLLPFFLGQGQPRIRIVEIIAQQKTL